MTIQIGIDISGRPMVLTGKPNHHICIQGMSGVGKTTLGRNLMITLVEQNSRVIIFDFTGDYQELTQLSDTIDVKLFDMRKAPPFPVHL